MARCLMVIKDICVLLVSKHSQKTLILCTIAVMLIGNKFAPVWQAHLSVGSSLRGISRTAGLAYNTVVSIVCDASQKAQRIS